MTPAHFHGNNIEVTVYKGLCEVINEHHHPVFMFLFINPYNSGEFWILIEVLVEKNDHSHDCFAQPEDINDFIANGELTLLTNQNKDGHSHKIYFDVNRRQGLTVDPIVTLGNFIGFNNYDIEDEDDDDEYYESIE